MEERGYLPQTVKEYDERRLTLTDAFDKLGMKYSRPQGTYFVLLVRTSTTSILASGSHASQDISNVHWPENYPFPESLHGRGRDFK